MPENLQEEHMSDPVCPSINEILHFAELLIVLGVMEVDIEFVLTACGRRKGVPRHDCVGAGVHINLDLLIPALNASKVLEAC